MYFSILNCISNADGRYEGNLEHYFKILFSAPNVENPYHNFRHMMHVTWEAYDAINFYNLEKRRGRPLLIAALFHDYGHRGVLGNDKANITIALQNVRHFILPEDKDLLPEIEGLISVTEYPHADCDPTLNAKILRDADMSQTFSDTWLQQIIFGLAKESDKTPLELLRMQPAFISSIVFQTEWAKMKYEEKRAHRLDEVERLLSIIE